MKDLQKIQPLWQPGYTLTEQDMEILGRMQQTRAYYFDLAQKLQDEITNLEAQLSEAREINQSKRDDIDRLVEEIKQLRNCTNDEVVRRIHKRVWGNELS